MPWRLLALTVFAKRVILYKGPLLQQCTVTVQSDSAMALKELHDVEANSTMAWQRDQVMTLAELNEVEAMIGKETSVNKIKALTSQQRATILEKLLAADKGIFTPAIKKAQCSEDIQVQTIVGIIRLIREEWCTRARFCNNAKFNWSASNCFASFGLIDYFLHTRNFLANETEHKRHLEHYYGSNPIQRRRLLIVLEEAQRDIIHRHLVESRKAAYAMWERTVLFAKTHELDEPSIDDVRQLLGDVDRNLLKALFQRDPELYLSAKRKPDMWAQDICRFFNFALCVLHSYTDNDSLGGDVENHTTHYNYITGKRRRVCSCGGIVHEGGSMDSCSELE